MRHWWQSVGGAAQLTEVKALLGCIGETRFVMGCISQLTCGQAPDEGPQRWLKAFTGVSMVTECL